MSPNPHSRMRITENDPERRLRTRLDLLLALMVVQLVLLIGFWIDRSRSSDGDRAEVAVMEKTLPDEALATRQKDEPSPPSPAEEAQIEPLAEAEGSEPVKVQILNGCSVTGIAAKMRDFLVNNGYDVRDVGNAARQDYSQSRIIDRGSNMDVARELAKLLGLSESQISRQTAATNPQVDLTLIIGRDYKRLGIAF